MEKNNRRVADDSIKMQLWLLREIEKELGLLKVKKLYNKYRASLRKSPFNATITGLCVKDVLNILKRKPHKIGPYKDITIFEAANRIASDLTLLEGVQAILSMPKYKGAKAQLRLGTMQVNGRGDFTIHLGRMELEGEAFNVAPSFYPSKLYKTLEKWKKIKNKYKRELSMLVFNIDALANGNKAHCEKKLEKIGMKTNQNNTSVSLWYR